MNGGRSGRREEFQIQSEFAELLAEYLDPAMTFSTAIENKPLSPLSGYLQQKRGVRAGLPDVLILVLRSGRRCGVVAVELKSSSGTLSKVQRQIARELEAVGARCWMARSARAAMTALARSRVPFRRPWKQPRLQAWEGPFPASAQRVPQHPAVAATLRRAARLRRARLQSSNKSGAAASPA